jgi:hypothetical protein
MAVTLLAKARSIETTLYRAVSRVVRDPGAEYFRAPDELTLSPSDIGQLRYLENGIGLTRGKRSISDEFLEQFLDGTDELSMSRLLKRCNFIGDRGAICVDIICHTGIDVPMITVAGIAGTSVKTAALI